MFKKIIAVATSVTMLFSGIAFQPGKKGKRGSTFITGKRDMEVSME